MLPCNLKIKNMINLTEEEVKSLMQFVEELPTKYGIPMVNFFSPKIEEAKKLKEDEQGEN